MKRLAIHDTWWLHRPTTLHAVVQPHRDGRLAAVDTIGLDLHKRESQLCELTEEVRLAQPGR